MLAFDVWKVFRDLGEGHRWAPGEEPAFFEKLFYWLYLHEIDLVEVLWGLAFVIFVYSVYRAIRYFWILFRPRQRDDLGAEIDAELVDERKRRYRELRRQWAERDEMLSQDR